jgi:hypothetical protein
MLHLLCLRGSVTCGRLTTGLHDWSLLVRPGIDFVALRAQGVLSFNH